MSEPLDFDLAWGGFYATTTEDSEQVSLFRLLDFHREGYHCAIYQEKFDAVPEAAATEGLSPFIGHAPIDAKGLLRYQSLSLVRTEPLARGDLDGYAVYLQEFGVPEAEQDELMERLIAYSHAEPFRLRLSLENGELKIEERA